MMTIGDSGHAGTLSRRYENMMQYVPRRFVLVFCRRWVCSRPKDLSSSVRLGSFSARGRKIGVNWMGTR